MNLHQKMKRNYIAASVSLISLYALGKLMEPQLNRWYYKYYLGIHVPAMLVSRPTFVDKHCLCIDKFIITSDSLEITCDNYGNLMKVVNNLDESFKYQKLIREIFPYCVIYQKKNLVFHDASLNIILKIVFDLEYDYMAYNCDQYINMFN